MKKNRKNPHEFVAKLRPNSILHEESLYHLEHIMGECVGHGWGFGGEDIEWHPSKSKDWWTSLSIESRQNKLVASFRKLYWEKESDYLPLSSLPVEWQNKLLKVIRKHTFKRSLPK